MYTFQLKVALVATAPNILNPADTKCLMLMEDGAPVLPMSVLDSQRPLMQIAADLLKEHTGIQARISGTGWIDLVQIPIFDLVEESVIIVPYGCMIPDSVVSLSPKAKWITMTDLFKQEKGYLYLEIIKQVALTI